MGRIILEIYRAPSGQWAGKVYEAGVVNPALLGGVGGCSSPEEVQEALEEVSIYADEVIIKETV